MSFYDRLNAEKSYHQGFFLATALAIAGICSLHPLLCFKGVSGKEKTRKKQKRGDLDAQAKEDEEWRMSNAPRVRHRRSRSQQPRVARSHHGQYHHHQRHRYSSADRDRTDSNTELSSCYSEDQFHRRPAAEARHRPDADRERGRRHQGDAPSRERRRRRQGDVPPQQHHHSS